MPAARWFASPSGPNWVCGRGWPSGIHLPPTDARRRPGFAGTIWLQQGSAPLADDAEDVLRGGAVLAARIMSRLAAAPSTHAVRVQELLGLAADPAPVSMTPTWVSSRANSGIDADGRAALIGFQGVDAPVPADVIALSASAFRADAQVASAGERVYVLLPKTGEASSVTSWMRGVVAALRRELGLDAAGGDRGSAGRAWGGRRGHASEVDRVFDSAERHPGAIGQVTSLDEARTTVLLDEIVTQIGADDRGSSTRGCGELREQEPMLADTLRVYLDGFGDIAAVAQRLHVHPNTVRYRVRRIEKLLVDLAGRSR